VMYTKDPVDNYLDAALTAALQVGRYTRAACYWPVRHCTASAMLPFPILPRACCCCCVFLSCSSPSSMADVAVVQASVTMKFGQVQRHLLISWFKVCALLCFMPRSTLMRAQVTCWCS
jgi:hypothetical protein